MKKEVVIILIIAIIFLLSISACKTKREFPSEIVIPPIPHSINEQKEDCISNEDCPQPRCPGMKGVCNKEVCEMQGQCETYECQKDEDCKKGGCSGQICESKYREPILTTCEFLPEYACYQQAKCGCVEERCSFKKSIVLDQCFAREKGGKIAPAQIN